MFESPSRSSADPAHHGSLHIKVNRGESYSAGLNSCMTGLMFLKSDARHVTELNPPFQKLPFLM
jgi:hypothetical protein